MANYKTLIDAQTWAFIDKTNSYYPENSTDDSAAHHRSVYDAMCAGFWTPHPEGITTRDLEYGGVPCRHYTSGANGPATVMYFHGGGYILGGLQSHDDVCAELCAATGCDVISVDYRLAPEFKHPAMFDDAMAATRAAQKALGLPIILCGDSAGGNLAAAVAHMSRGQDMQIIGQVLIYPGLGGDFDKGSYIEHANAPLLTRDEMQMYRFIRLAGEEPVGDPSYAPLHDTDFTGLPPTVISTAECDPLSDDGGDYEAALNAADVQVHWVNERGLVHGHLRARHMSDRAAASFERIKAAVSALARGEWPYS